MIMLIARSVDRRLIGERMSRMRVLEKILEEIEEETKQEDAPIYCGDVEIDGYVRMSVVEDIIRNHMNDGWIPVDERMPKCEEEVWIITERGTQTSAMYEDGTMLDKNSAWNWTDINGEWDEQEDCMIIPEGWWEYRHFNPDDVYNNTVDEKVIAWQPLPESYKRMKIQMLDEMKHEKA